MADQKKKIRQENELITLSNRRLNNARMQLKSVVLECYEIFGETFTHEVLEDCAQIFNEYKSFKSELNG